MATVTLLEYKDAPPEVRAVYDDICRTRKTDDVNQFWKALAHQPENLKRVWEQMKQVMGAGSLDPLTKELIYLAVSVTNGCTYCIHSHTAAARAKGLTDAQYQEFVGVVGLAQQTNAIVTALQVPTDPRFLAGGTPANR